MTTRVTIDAHAGWAVLVTVRTKHHADKNQRAFYSCDNEIWFEHNERVEANTQRDFYIHDGLQISKIQEIKNA